MASSDNLIYTDPSWIFRNNPFADTWFPDTFSKETETFTKALQKSFDTQDYYFSPLNFSEEDLISPPWPNSPTVSPTSTQTPTGSGGSAAEVVFTSKRKISKRKSRASNKREKTMFINADAADFRRLVEEFTGVKFNGNNGVVNVSQVVVKPEAQRAVNRLQMIGSLPTLDTSSFLLDPTFQNKETVVGGVAPPSDGGSASLSQFDFDSFCSFPTLESWKGV